MRELGHHFVLVGDAKTWNDIGWKSVKRVTYFWILNNPISKKTTLEACIEQHVALTWLTVAMHFICAKSCTQIYGLIAR